MIYYGISNDEERRLLEHAAEKTFAYMKVLSSKELNHDVARTLEGGLIRQRLAAGEALLTDIAETVQDRLANVNLQNKNRGRDPSSWVHTTPDGDVSTDLWDLVHKAGRVLPFPTRVK